MGRGVHLSNGHNQSSDLETFVRIEIPKKEKERK